MNNLKFPLLITMLSVMVLVFGSCTDDPCDGVDCGANGVPIEDVVFGTCECNCDAGFTNGPNGNCIADGCAGQENLCGDFGTPTATAGGDCFCVCDEGYNNDAGGVCVPNFVCDDSNCINGSCVDNACACEEGYSGDTCETLVISKFFGTWTAEETCMPEMLSDVCPEFSDTYDMTIEQNGTNTMNVVISGFFGSEAVGGVDTPYFSALIGDISGDNIDVTFQANDHPSAYYETSGTGTYAIDADGVETITYAYELLQRDGPGLDLTCTENCTAVWTKQ